MTGQTGNPETHVVMGRIGAVWGIKGWVKVFSFAEPPENLLEYSHFYIKEAGVLKQIELDQLKPHGKGFVGHIKGCDVREEAGRFTGCELLIPKSELPGLEEGYYWHELEGLRVETVSGEVLGTVHHMMETGANDVLVVRGDEHSVDREERLVPWIPGQVITEVDLDQKVISVDWDKDY